MSKPKQIALLIFANSVIIFGTMYWSGWISERSLYDKYIIDFDGVIVPYENYDAAVLFYSQVLNFKPLIRRGKDSKKVIGFEVSKKRRLYLEPKEQVPNTGGAILAVRVRNGFDELHSQLVVRSEKPVQRATEKNYLALEAKGVITSVIKRPWGSEFVAYDYEGNRVVFSQPKPRSAMRNSKSKD